uniref:Uncharacterized protein n=1 Tax=Octopus bimaculoides TaxID=37653 RepID=A0A0L8HZP7_OCTBM
MEKKTLKKEAKNLSTKTATTIVINITVIFFSLKLLISQWLFSRVFYLCIQSWYYFSICDNASMVCQLVSVTWLHTSHGTYGRRTGLIK